MKFDDAKMAAAMEEPRIATYTRTPIPVVPLTWADRLPPGQIRDRALVLGRKRQLDLSDVDTPGLRDGLPVSDQPLQM